MFGLGWTELLVIGIVALVVVGPEDLPQMFRAIGRFTGKARAMAREFSRAMEDAADQAGVNEINKTIRAAANPAKFGTDSIRSAAGLGPETKKLSAEREEAKRKIQEATAKKAEERLAREAREREIAEMEAELAEDDAEAFDMIVAAPEAEPAASPAPESGADDTTPSDDSRTKP